MKTLSQNNRRYLNEHAMYPEVCEWLQGVWKSRFPKSARVVADTSRMTLSNYLEQEGLTELFPDYQTYEINVDVTGVVKRRNPALAFVECKLSVLTLRDISQLLGYSKVAKPIYAILVSPAGMSKALTLLLQVYRRYDVLEYSEQTRLKIGVWDAVRKTVDPATVIPIGDHF